MNTFCFDRKLSFTNNCDEQGLSLVMGMDFNNNIQYLFFTFEEQSWNV